MGEDLKLFGEVGLGYNQLQKDAEHINKLLNDIDKNAKLLGESFNKHKLDPNTAKTAKELEKMYQEVVKLSGGNNIAEQSTKELAKSINELAKKLKISEEEIAKSLKSMSSFNLNTKDFEKQAKDVKKFVDIQRQELTKWAKEKTSLAKELSLRDISKMVNDDYRNASKSGSATEKAEAIKRVGQAMSVLNYTMEQNKAKVKDLQVEYDKLKTKANALTGETKKIANAQASSVKKQITDITRETGKLETQAGRLDKILNFSSADQSAKSTTKSLGMLLGQAYAIKRAFGYINKEVMEFERNAVEIQRIAGYTKKEMDDLAQSTFDMGKNMGLNVNTIQEIEGLWARAGRSGQALVDATKTTALGFNVAEFKDAESAVASLNAIINQMYNGDATKAPEILDALTKVADKTAVRNVNDLVEVVSRAGANAKSLGMNLHELNAASSIVMERMKTTGDVLGTQFKTIFAYMADGKRIDKLKKYGVEFTNIGKDGTESLKPFMEMMDNLVAKYKELQSQGKDVMANDMIKNLSGVRNVATLKNLVEGWDSMRERVLLSQNSKGFAERQNAKMMETYAKKVEQLKVSFQELAVAIGNNGLLDAMKHIADGTKAGVEFFSKYNKEIMTLTKTVATFYATMKTVEGVRKIFGANGLGGMFGMLTGTKYSGLEKAGTILSKLSGTEAFKSKKDQEQMLFEGFAKMGASAGGAVSPIKMLTSAMGGLKAQVVSMTAGMSMAVPVIGAVAIALGALLTKMYIDKQKRLNILDDFTSGKANEAIGNIRELKKELDEITNTEAFKRGDANALDAYKSTTEELARLLGINHSVIVGNKESMEVFNKTLVTTIGLKEREYELNRQIAKQESEAKMKKMAGKDGFGGDNNIGELGRAINKYENLVAKVQTLQDKINNGDPNVWLSKRLDKSSQDMSKAHVEVYKLASELKELQAVTGMTDEELKKLFDGKQLSDGTPVYDALQKIIESSPDVKDGLNDIGEGADGAKDAIDELKESIDDLLSEFDDIGKQTNTIDNAFKELYENGSIKNGTVMKLLDVDPEMVDYIYKTKDGYGLLEGAIDHYNEKQQRANELTDEALNTLREKADMATDIDGNPLANAMQSQELQQNLDDMVSAVQDSIGKTNVAFEDGKTGVDEFFGKLKEAKDDADLSNLLSGIDTSQITALNGTLANDLQTTLTNLRGEFDSGVINIEQYAGAMSDAQGEALKLYTEINNLHQNDEGVWVNQAGQVDQFANALQNSVTHIDGAKDAYGRLMDAFEKTPDMALIFADDAFDIPRDQLNTFAEDFTAIMQDTKDNNKEVWDAIVKDIMEQTGMSKEETEKCLTDTNEFVKLQDTAVKSAVKVSFGHLAKALNLTEAQIAKTARGIKAKLSALADYALSKMSVVNMAMGGSALKQPKDHFKEIPRTPIGNALSVTNTMESVLNGGKTKVATPSGRLVEKQITVSDMYSTSLEEYAKQTAQLKSLNAQADKVGAKLDTELNTSSDVLNANNEKLQQWYDKNNKDDKKSPRSGRGRNGSGSKSTQDVPKAVEDALEDLRHELEMGRISEDQFYKGVEKLYNNNSGKMSKRGKQKFEKMIKDAKTKADDSIPPYAKVLIDDLEDQLKYGEIDQYTYSSKLDDIARRYKNKLGKKAIKDIEKKISEAKVGGLDKYFKSQIDEFESIIKVSDLAVKKIQAEQSLYQALNMGDTSGMSLQGAKINIINNKLFATEALAKKYESVLKVINEEVKKLDKNSSSYKNTLHGLATKQEEFTNKLNETRVAIIDLQKQRIEEQMKVYDAMQKKYDDAVSSMEQIESKLVTFIQQRNQKIREQIDKNHKAKMDSLDKETKARDKELEKEKKRLQDALEAYRKYTQGKIDSLDKEAEEEDYNKELKKKMDERDELQYRINSLSLDDTSTARGKRIELTKQLADKNNEIEEFQKDRARKLTKEGLQDQLKDYEESLEKKQKKLDDQSKREQEQLDNRRKALEEEHQRELALLDEKMKASFVYAEAKQAILSGYVQDATGASIAIRDAMIQGMREQGQASGILAQKYINDLDAVIRKAREAQQIMGMAKSSASAGSLQAHLGLTDEGYREYLGNKARDLGFTDIHDTERYINNKRGWASASASERKRLADENHRLRAKYAGDPRNWNNKNINKDRNGEVLGMSWIEDTGSAMKVGQTGGQFTPLGGSFGRDEARNSALADLGLGNPYTSGSSQAWFENQMSQFQRMGMPYTQPSLSDWTNRNYAQRYREQSEILNKYARTPADMSDYAGALGYIKSYKEDLQNNFNNDQTGMGFPSDNGDNSTREALMSAAKAQDGLPYSQGSERYSTHRDCSSYVYYAVKNSGLYGGDGFYTGDMIPKLAQYGWQDLGHIPKEQIRRGDIFWIRDGKHNHTEIATQDGTLNSTGAHSAKKPAGPSVWAYDYRILRNPKINGYSQGGIADYTGVAMLHGTKSSPEYIFNAPQFDALGRMIANYVSAPAIYGHGVYNGTTSSLPEINIDTLINIEGNADQSTVREIERQSDEILDKLIIGLKKRGVRR